MSFSLLERQFQPVSSKRISKTLLLSLAKRAAKYSPSKQRSSLTAGTPETSSTSPTLAAMPVLGTHSTWMGAQRRWKSSSRFTRPMSKSRLKLSQRHQSKQRVPSKTALLVYRLYAPKAFRKAHATMDYSTLRSILKGPTPDLGKTSWWSTTSNMWLPLSRIMRCKSSSSKPTKKITTTSARTRRSIASAIQASAVRESSALAQTVLMRLR